MKRSRAYLPSTRHALTVLGSQIAIARRQLGWTAADLAERLGVKSDLISRIEKGAATTAIGTVFEAAVLCGVPLYAADPADLSDLVQRQYDQLALLPARVRPRVVQVSDEF